MQPSAEGEAQSHLTKVLSVCEDELAALETLADSRLALILNQMYEFRLDLIAAIRGLERSGA